jgi:hypothetical protein
LARDEFPELLLMYLAVQRHVYCGISQRRIQESFGEFHRVNALGRWGDEPRAIQEGRSEVP